MDINEAIDAVCLGQGIERESLLNDKCDKVIMARNCLWVYLHCESGFTIRTIMQAFGRSRRTVFRGIRLIRDVMGYSKDIQRLYADVSADVKAL